MDVTDFAARARRPWHRFGPGPAALMTLVVAGGSSLTTGSTALAQGITDKSLVLQRQSLALPAAGVPVVDPVFGTTLRRFTDRTDNGGYATPVYSQLQAFSYDNDYILLNENDDYVIRRMSDRSVVSGLTLEWNNPRWQPAASLTRKISTP